MVRDLEERLDDIEDRIDAFMTGVGDRFKELEAQVERSAKHPTDDADPDRPSALAISGITSEDWLRRGSGLWQGVVMDDATGQEYDLRQIKPFLEAATSDQAGLSWVISDDFGMRSEAKTLEAAVLMARAVHQIRGGKRR